MEIYYKDAINYAFFGDLVETLPKAVRQSSCFCIDLTRFKIEDSLLDGNGIYIEYGNKSKYCIVVIKDKILEITPTNFKDSKFNPSLFLIKRATYKSDSNSWFFRKTLRITAVNEKNFDRLVLVYYCSEKDKIFQIKPHGNATKTDKPYFRTSVSTIKKVKELSVKCGSAPLKFNKLVEEIDPVSGFYSDIPRDLNQFYRHKSYQMNLKNKNVRTKDQYLDALINRNKSSI